LLTQGGLQPGVLVARDGIIEAILPYDEQPKAARAIDVGDQIVFPGLVDGHVHLNEPGRADWEGFETGTAAAAAGGVTTLVDMPLNSSPVTTTAAALEAKRSAAQGKIRVDVGFHGGLVAGGASRISELITGGVLGIKAFLCNSGLEEFQAATLDDVRAALPQLRESGLPLWVHAELENDESRSLPPPPQPLRRYLDWTARRPASMEVEAIHALLRLSQEFGTALHIVHLATPAALPFVEMARRNGVAVTVETCPHYLNFAAEEIPDGSVPHKCAPPIRSALDREGLWRGLERGSIDLIASDHSPCPPGMKDLAGGDFTPSWGGISSLQLLLPATWTRARQRGLAPEVLADWLCHRPAVLLGLAGRKGALVPGYDADCCVWDPDTSFEVDPTKLHHRHPITPYAGMTLHGTVTLTVLRGAVIADGGKLADKPHGAMIRRNPT